MDGSPFMAAWKLIFKEILLLGFTTWKFLYYKTLQINTFERRYYYMTPKETYVGGWRIHNMSPVKAYMWLNVYIMGLIYILVIDQMKDHMCNEWMGIYRGHVGVRVDLIWIYECIERVEGGSPII